MRQLVSIGDIADNLSKAGWRGCVAAVDRNGRTIFVADAHRGDGNRFIVDRVSGIGNGDLYLPVEPPGAVDGKLTAICVRGRTAAGTWNKQPASC